MHTHRVTLARLIRIGISAFLAVIVAAGPVGAVTAPATSLTLRTPYPGVSIAPGSRASFDLTVASDGPVRADLTLSGVPEGWTAQITGGGNVVTAVLADAEAPANVRLDVTV